MTPHLLIEEAPGTGVATFIQSLRTADGAECGGKAARLAQLTRSGFAVPDGFVITSAALEHLLDRQGLRHHIADLTPKLDSPEFEIVSHTIRRHIREIQIAGDLRTGICDATSALGGGPLIVRSSGCGEDGLAASFAGQFDSHGDLYSQDEVLAAIVRVWASRWSDRVLTYASATGAALAGIGVVVQRQIAGCWSGVLFSESPVRSGEMLLEFCAGGGDALVSGRVDPGRVAIARSDLRWSLLASADAAGSVPSTASILTGDTLTSLARTGLAIERAFGTPQDIEWTLDADGRMWIVQARPITATRAPASVAAPASPALREPPSDVVWSNANVNENFPDLISPLLYSIARDGYYHYFRNLGRGFGVSRRRLEAMEQPLREIVGVHQARLYYNLTSIHAVLRSAPCGALLADSFDQFVGAEATPTAPAVPFTTRARAGLATALELARIVLQTTWQFLFLKGRVSRFERRIDAFASSTHPDALRTRSREGLLRDLRAFLDIRRHRWNDAALADTGSMVCYGLLQRVLARACPEAGRQSLHNSLLKGLPGLVSGKPALALWDLAMDVRAHRDLSELFRTHSDEDVLGAITTDPQFAGFARSLADFQDRWGFRCSGELMLTAPSFQEDPLPLIALIRSYAACSGESPAAILDRQAEARVAETVRLRRELRSRQVVPYLPARLQAVAILRVLAWTQTCVCLRERARLAQALLYTRLRRIVLALGARLVDDGRLLQADDVFFLTSGEIEALAGGTAMFPTQTAALVSLRRSAHVALSKVTPPDRFTLPRGEYFAGVGTSPETPADPATGLSGLGACGGLAAGPATVLGDVREAHRLRSGDILVTRQTDPGWGPAFPLIAGLVIERGGMLSHGAIIAREFGIPAVIGVRGATRLITNGQRLVVDGDRGVVSIEDRAS